MPGLQYFALRRESYFKRQRVLKEVQNLAKGALNKEKMTNCEVLLRPSHVKQTF